jgi:hypothetical protein
MKKTLTTILLTMILVFSVFTHAYAEQDTTLMTLIKDDAPNVFEVTQKASGTGEIVFRLENQSELALMNTMHIYDAITLDNGGTKKMDIGDYTTSDVAAWFEAPTQPITLKSEEKSERIKIAFTVPEETPLGKYCAIFALAGYHYSSTPNNAMMLDIIITVPGDYEPSMTLDEGFKYERDEQAPSMTFFIPFTNKSTAFDYPSFEAKIYDQDENVVLQHALKADIVYHNQSAFFVFEDKINRYTEGTYRVDIVMDYGSGELASRDVHSYNFTILKKAPPKIVEEEIAPEETKRSILDNNFSWIFDNITQILIGTIALMVLLSLISIISVAIKKRRGRHS